MGFLGGINNLGKSRSGASPKTAGLPKTDGDNPPKDRGDGLGPLVRHRDVLGATRLAGDTAIAGASRPSVPPLTRKLSVISQKTVETLEGLEEELGSMKVHCDEAEHDLDHPGEDGFRAGLRGDLATMHGNANRLLATRLDAILTSELTSGRDAARAKRKVLIGQSEALIDRCELLVKRYDAEKDATGIAAARPELDAAPSEQ